MGQHKLKMQNVTDQEDALTVYLQALLSDEEICDKELCHNIENISDDIETENASLLVEVIEDKIDEPLLVQATEKHFVGNNNFESEPLVIPTEFKPESEPEKIDFAEPPPALPLPSLTNNLFAPSKDVDEEIVDDININTDAAININNNIKNNVQINNNINNHSDETIDAESETDKKIEIPEWAQTRFQCLMFSAAGIKVAAPLEKLNGIIEWPDSITVLPGHRQWFLGLYRNRDQNVQVVDLAMLLNIDTAGEGGINAVANRAKYIMLIDGGRIGLASDTVANMLTLEPTDVKWQCLASDQAIIAGTVVEHMCSVLDIESLVEHIKKS